MFPNVRLLIGTLFIALLVLSCEFGVFAALRVNREPLSRLTAESTPLQLSAGNNARPAATMSWATPVESHAPAPIATPAMQQVAAPSAIKAAARDERAPAQPAASAAAAQGAPAGTAAAAPAQELAVPPPSLAAAATQQTPASAAIAPAQPQTAQPALEPQAHQSVAKASEPKADAPVAAAAAAVAAPAPAAQPAEITGSIPNAATPAPMPQAAAPPKAVHKSAKTVHKPGKIIRRAALTPAQVRNVAKKRIVRRAQAPAAASSAQLGSTFNNTVFESEAQFQSPAKNRPRTKKAETNNDFGNPFATQLGTH